MRTNKKRSRAWDPLLTEVEQELCLGRFMRYGNMFDFVAGLEGVEKKLASLVSDGVKSFVFFDGFLLTYFAPI